MAVITDLNNDILLQVFSYIKSETRTLRRLARVCHKFLPFCREFLFREISIYTETEWQHGRTETTKLSLLLRSISSDNSLAPLIRHLDIYWYGDSRDLDLLVQDLLSRVTHLYTLSLVTTGVTRHRPNYLEANPFPFLRKFTFTGRIDPEDYALYMGLEQLESIAILQGEDCGHQPDRPPSSLRGTSPVSEITICSDSLYECNLMYALAIPRHLKILKCSFPYFEYSCENPLCSANAGLPDSLCSDPPESQVIFPRLMHRLEKATPFLEELRLEDPHCFIKKNALYSNFSMLGRLQFLQAPAHCLFSQEGTLACRDNFYKQLPRSLRKLEIFFTLRTDMRTGVFSKNWKERKVFDASGHQNVKFEDYKWILHLAQFKTTSFPELHSVVLVERCYAYFPMKDSHTLHIPFLPRGTRSDQLVSLFAPETIISSRIVTAPGNDHLAAYARFESREVCDRLIDEYSGKTTAAVNGTPFTITLRNLEAIPLGMDDNVSPVLWKQPDLLAESMKDAEINLEVRLRPSTELAYRTSADFARRRIHRRNIA